MGLKQMQVYVLIWAPCSAWQPRLTVLATPALLASPALHSGPRCELETSVPCSHRLSDFGFSKDENYHSAPGSRVGTPAYLAPEVISNVMGRSYDAKVGSPRRYWRVWEP